MRRIRRAKILATLGPASNEESMIEELAKAGADVFRINMSHASHELMHQTVKRIRAAKRAQWELFRLLGADGVDVAAATSRSHLGGDELERQ